jgi:hypothetical protein
MDQTISDGTPESFKTIFRDSLRFWERRRVIYNLALTAVTLAWLIFTWPHFAPVLTLDSLVKLLVLAVIANVAYSAVYVADIPLQLSSMRRPWQRRRWILWLVGMFFAILVTCYWIADEIYPYVSQAFLALPCKTGPFGG